MIWSEERSSQLNWNERNSTVWTEDKVEEFTFWDEMQCLFRGLRWKPFHKAENLQTLPESHLMFWLGVPPPGEMERRQTPGRYRWAEWDREGNKSTLRGGWETSSGWCFPNRNTPRESSERAARHICCVGGTVTSQNAVWLTFDLAVECCSSISICTHVLVGRCRRSANGNVCVVKVVVVSFGCALIIHVACGRLIEMNILLLLIRAIARVMEHLAVLPG